MNKRPGRAGSCLNLIITMVGFQKLGHTLPSNFRTMKKVLAFTRFGMTDRAGPLIREPNW